MIKDLILKESALFKKYILIEIGYVIFDVATLAVINLVLGTILPGQQELRHVILFISALVAAVYFFLQAQKMASRLTENVTGNIRGKIIEKVHAADLLSFETLGRSQIYNAITLDTQVITDVAHIIMWLIDCSLLCVGLLLYLAIVCKPAFVFAALIFGFGSFVYSFQIARTKKWIHQAREKEKELFDAISDVIYGFKELKVNDEKNDDFFFTRFKAKASENRTLRTKAEYILADSNVIASIVELSVFIPILFILPALGELSVHALLVSVTVLLFIPFNQVKDTIPYIVRAWISVERLQNLENDLESITPDASMEPPDIAAIGFSGLNYHHINFTYTDPDGNPLFSLDDVSLFVHPGEILFITGGNGSGKSTLLKVLTGLYPIYSGHIELDGEKVSLSGHGSLFSVIFDDFHLFDRLYGMPGVDPAKVNELLALMELSDVLKFEDNRFSRLDLSSGQRKRLALITTILEDKPVYVFDEWASDQSPIFREYFYHRLLPSFKAKGKTVIAVTHDDRFFHVADRLYKLDYGRLSPVE